MGFVKGRYINVRLICRVEGKIIMEGYKPFLEFIEKQVRESGKRWAIVGAFKCFID